MLETIRLLGGSAQACAWMAKPHRARRVGSSPVKSSTCKASTHTKVSRVLGSKIQSRLDGWRVKERFRAVGAAVRVASGNPNESHAFRAVGAAVRSRPGLVDDVHAFRAVGAAGRSMKEIRVRNSAFRAVGAAGRIGAVLVLAIWAFRAVGAAERSGMPNTSDWGLVPRRGRGWEALVALVARLQVVPRPRRGWEDDNLESEGP